MKIIRSILLLIICIGISDTFAVDMYSFKSDGLYYAINSGDSTVTVWIKGKQNGEYVTDDYSGYITIPPSVTYNGKTYKVVSITGYAFVNCSKLKGVSIPNTVKKIVTNAFRNCTGLTSIDIPSSTTSLNYAFYGCKNLKDINVSEENPRYSSVGGIVYSKQKDTLFFCPEGKEGNIIIPNSTKVIGQGLYDGFRNCSKIKNITIPNGVEYVSACCFENCSSLVSLTIPNNCSTIMYNNKIIGIDFSGCSALKKVEIGKKILQISGNAFKSCTSLDTIVFNSDTPPTATTQSFNGLSKTVAIVVPCNKKSVYQSDAAYSTFTNISEYCGKTIVENYLSIDICQNESYFFKGQNLTKEGDYSDTIEVDDNTDSIVYLTLKIHPTYNSVVYDTITLDQAGENHSEVEVNQLQSIFGCDSTVNVITYYKYTKPQSIDDVKQSEKITIYPNPAREYITVEAKEDIVIYNSLGQTVKNISNPNGTVKVNIQTLPKGVYYIKTNNELHKFIKE